MRHIECALLVFGMLNAVQVHPVRHDNHHILRCVDCCAALPHLYLPIRQGNAVLVDSSGSGHSAWTNIHTCLAFNPTVGGLQFVNRGYSPTGHIYAHQAPPDFSLWIHDVVYQEGPGRYPSSIAADLAIVAFSTVDSATGSPVATAVAQIGGWFGGAWGTPVTLPNGGCPRPTGCHLPTGNILFVCDEISGLLPYYTTSPDLSIVIASGNLASNSQLWGVDCSGGMCYVYWYNLADLSVWYRTTIDGITWTDAIQWELEYPTPYASNALGFPQMAVTDAGDPILVFDISDGNDMTYPYSSKVYVSNASGATPIEVSDNTYGVWSYPTICSGGGNIVVVMQVAQDTTLIDSLARHDIFYRASADGGATWGNAVNLTEGSTNRPGLPQCAKRVDATNGNFFYFYGVDMVENHDPFFHLVYDYEGLDPFAWYVGWHAIPTGITEHDRVHTPQHILLEISPNPFRGTTNIRFTIQDSGCMMENSVLSIYDVAGRVVKSLNLESCIVNPVSRVTWCGDNNSGRPVPAGVYLLRLHTGNESFAEKIIKLE